MTFEDSCLLIPQYLSGELQGKDKEVFEEQLRTDANLRHEFEALQAVWDELGALPQEVPDASVRAKFYQRLNALERDRPKVVAPSVRREWKLWAQMAAAALIFVAGLSVGRLRLSEPGQADELARMSSQVQNLRELVALSLLERQSAASRLEGVAYSSSIAQPDEEVVSALLQALNHDSNVNVRLSSVDALERFTKNTVISKALIDSIEHQDSPLVQIALIDSIVSVRNRSAAGELRKLTVSGTVNPAVRQRAQWGLQKLSIE